MCTSLSFWQLLPPFVQLLLSVLAHPLSKSPVSTLYLDIISISLILSWEDTGYFCAVSDLREIAGKMDHVERVSITGIIQDVLTAVSKQAPNSLADSRHAPPAERRAAKVQSQWIMVCDATLYLCLKRFSPYQVLVCRFTT